MGMASGGRPMGGGYGQQSGGQSTMPRFGNSYTPQPMQGYRPGFQSGGMQGGYGGYQPQQMQRRPQNYGGFQGGGMFQPGGFEQNGMANQGGGYGGGYGGGNAWTEQPLEQMPGSPTYMPPPRTGGPSPYTPTQTPPPPTGGLSPGPTTNPANVAQAQQGTRWMSDWGGQGNVFDPAIMAQNGWGFDASGRWNGPVPDEFRNAGSRGDGFTGIRDGGFFVNGRDIVGEQYLGGKLDPNNLGAMGGGGSIRDMLGTLGFVGRGQGGGGGLMGQPAAPAASTAATRPAGTSPGGAAHALPTGGPGLTHPGGGVTRGGLMNPATNLNRFRRFPNFGPNSPFQY